MASTQSYDKRAVQHMRVHVRTGMSGLHGGHSATELEPIKYTRLFKFEPEIPAVDADCGHRHGCCGMQLSHVAFLPLGDQLRPASSQKTLGCNFLLMRFSFKLKQTVQAIF